MEGRPCHTIYINNINDKIKKMELLRQIYSLCSTYGQVKFKIVVRLPLKIVYFEGTRYHDFEGSKIERPSLCNIQRNFRRLCCHQTSTGNNCQKQVACSVNQTVINFQGFPFYDKPLRVAFARRESTVITAAKKYQAPKDERAQAKGQSNFQKSFLTLRIEPGQRVSTRDVVIRY